MKRFDSLDDAFVYVRSHTKTRNRVRALETRCVTVGGRVVPADDPEAVSVLVRINDVIDETVAQTLGVPYLDI